MRSTAADLARHVVRCYAVLPASTATPLWLNETTLRLFRDDVEHPTLEDAHESMTSMNLLPIPYMEPSDVFEAVLWLASDLCRDVTGVVHPVDAGASLR